jgi:hypothetical protein
MAETISASIITLHQPRRPKTDAERAKAYRDRKRQKALLVVNPLAGENPAGLRDVETRPASGTHDVLREAAPGTGVETGATAIGTNIVPQTIDFGHGQIAHAVTLAPVTLPVTSRRPLASIALTVAAFALAGTGLTMNAWFARSLGSTDSAGLMFLAVGVAADLAALAVPSCAARLWETRQRGSAAFGWLIWLATFVFAVTAGIGFASTNISDVTLARASRITPVILSAQAALADAMASRDRECKGGVGKFCREREQIVNDRRQSLADAAHAVEQEADPQTEAAKRIVAWISHGWLTPSSDDFALLRLVLLALLPQVGGVLLMLSRVR